MFVTILCGYGAYSLSLEMTQDTLIMSWYDFVGIVLFMMFLNNFILGRFGFYSEKRFSNNWIMLKNLIIALTLSHVLLMTLAIMIGINPFPRSFVLPYFLFTMSSLMIIRLILHAYFDRRSLTPSNSRQILLVGSLSRIREIKEQLDKQPSWGHQISGYLDEGNDGALNDYKMKNMGKLSNFNNILKDYGIDEVVFVLPKDSTVELRPFIEKCHKLGVSIRIVPAMFDFKHPAMQGGHIQGIPTLSYQTGGIASASGFLYKRILDIIAGVGGLIILMLIYPVIAIAIKLDSPGNVIFKQVRVGQNNRRFNLYKFRTMIQDAELKKRELLTKSDMQGPIFKMENDPRITKVGKFLRKTSLDEFPQFINVLKGEMSLVGTRPPTPDEVEKYEDWHRRRISMKPGITGLWQVSGRNKISDFNKVVELDLKYIDNWSFWADIMIILKTVWVVLARKGAI
ncbi:MAG: sugar transferase [Deltaproteobacteria bacterium]|nr:sugar transferase [Deltaproteobacteria bacterium]